MDHVPKTEPVLLWAALAGTFELVHAHEVTTHSAFDAFERKLHSHCFVGGRLRSFAPFATIVHEILDTFFQVFYALVQFTHDIGTWVLEKGALLLVLECGIAGTFIGFRLDGSHLAGNLGHRRLGVERGSAVAVIDIYGIEVFLGLHHRMGNWRGLNGPRDGKQFIKFVAHLEIPFLTRLQFIVIWTPISSLHRD